MFFSWSVLYQEHAIQAFCKQRFSLPIFSYSPFSFNIFLAFLDPLLRFLINVNYTKSRSKLEQKRYCLINIMWSLRCTDTISSGALLISSSLSHNLEKGHRTCNIFCWNFSMFVSWFRNCALCIIMVFAKSSNFLTPLIFSGAGCRMRRYSPTSFSGIKHSNWWFA